MAENTPPEEKQKPYGDLQKGEFIAGGRKYVVNGDISIARYCELQNLEMELHTGGPLAEHVKRLIDLKGLMNGLRFVDAAVLLDDMIQGRAKIGYKEPHVLRYCALFCDYEGEDTTVYNETIMTQKINDFKASGLSFRFFFALASLFLKNYVQTMNEYTGNMVNDRQPHE
jgi:hypothetical protein